jgi:hypothetical protein
MGEFFIKIKPSFRNLISPLNPDTISYKKKEGGYFKIKNHSPSTLFLEPGT